MRHGWAELEARYVILLNSRTPTGKERNGFSNRFAASAVLMIFMAQVYHLKKYGYSNIILLTSENSHRIVTRTKNSGLASALTLANPYTANS
jgi:hypothetical protein